MQARNALLPLLLSLLAIALPAARRAGATSYVMVADRDLADQASIIAEVRVVAAEPSPAETMPATDYQVNIERLLKGSSGGSAVMVRVPGGVRADGRGVKIWGAPEFAPGDRALLFLTPRADGTYAILHLMLGAFHIFDPAEIARAAQNSNGTTAGDSIPRRALTMRNLADAQEVKLRPDGGLSEAPGQDRPRDLERFAGWLDDRAHGVRRAADYLVKLPASVQSKLAAKFTVFISHGHNIRWFEFDDGGTVPFSMFQAGQPGLAGGGFNELQIAIQVWNDYPLTPIHYVYAGPTSASGGLTNSDGVNAILFADPHNELSSPFSCDTGGILAHGGPWFDPSNTGVFNGTTYIRTLEADIVTNKGLECFFQRSAAGSKAAQELFAHELGHTLGLGHSCGDSKSPPCPGNPVLNDALMRTFIHDDGRGARLGADDQAGIRRLYQPGAQGAGCTEDKNTLCLLNGRFAVTATWQNQFNSTSGSAVAVPRSDVTGFLAFFDPANVELLIKVLDFGSTIKVFYGELTNLHFTVTVNDTLTSGVKTYSNTPGDCGAIDQSAFQSAASTAGSSAGGGASSSGLYRRPGKGGRIDLAGLSQLTAGASGTCRPDRNTLCLLSGRFALTVSWTNQFDGSTGQGGAAQLSDLVGTFFFSDPGNVELMTKMINFGDRVAVFYGALSDLGYTINVTDTISGKGKSYKSTPGKLCGGLDNSAFGP